MIKKEILPYLQTGVVLWYHFSGTLINLCELPRSKAGQLLTTTPDGCEQPQTSWQWEPPVNTKRAHPVLPASPAPQSQSKHSIAFPGCVPRIAFKTRNTFRREVIHSITQYTADRKERLRLPTHPWNSQLTATGYPERLCSLHTTSSRRLDWSPLEILSKISYPMIFWRNETISFLFILWRVCCPFFICTTKLFVQQ